MTRSRLTQMRHEGSDLFGLDNPDRKASRVQSWLRDRMISRALDEERAPVTADALESKHVQNTYSLAPIR